MVEPHLSLSDILTTFAMMYITLILGIGILGSVALIKSKVKK